MDKGIFYLLCTLVILLALGVVGYSVDKRIATYCGVRTVVQQKLVTVTPAISPTATPSATIKRVSTVGPVKPSGVK